MLQVTETEIDNLVRQMLDEVNCVFASVTRKDVEIFAGIVAKASRVFVFGAGRVGIGSRALAMRLMHLGKASFWVTDDTTPAIGVGDLLIVNSGSGGSVSSLNLASQAKKSGAMIATITANPKGEIASLSDVVLALPAKTFKMSHSPYRTILPMGSQFELCLWIAQDVLSLFLMAKMGIEESDMIRRHRNLE